MPAIFCVIFLFYPFCTFLAEGTGYRFSLYHDVLTSFVTAVLFACATAGMLLCKIEIRGMNRVFVPLLLPISCFCEIVFYFRTDQSARGVMLALAILSCVCAVVLFVKFPGFFAVKITGGVLTFLIFILVCCLLLINGIFGNLSSDTVIRAVKSPDGVYLAEVVRSEQGALGGNTFVNVTKPGAAVPILVGEFTMRPYQVYSGEYDEYVHMDIAWEDNTTLRINGEAYIIE